jgi:hypothetical protein
MKNYSSSDFYLCAVCLACNCTIDRLEKQPGNFVEFVFKDSPDKCLEIIASYWDGKLLVDPKKLISAINELKTRLHNGS